MGLRGFAIAGLLGLVCVGASYATARRPADAPFAPPSHLDRVVIIVLENYRSHHFTPFLSKLASENRFATNYFGVWRPSLPNYIAMIAGDFFGVSDDAESCFNSEHQEPCNGFDAPNLVDQLEKAHIAWEGLFESMPSQGFLGARFPEDSKLYAQKHNPFVYFKSVALDPGRLAKLKPFVLDELQAELADSVSASRFIYIVPNQCSDQHGTLGCKSAAAKLGAGDTFLAEVVPAIINAPAFTERSVLFIVWDESNGREACCGAVKGGGHIPLIALTKRPTAIKSDTPSNHYSLLATIEDGFGLPRLANAKASATLFDLFPEFAERAHSGANGRASRKEAQ
jgi:hypothetical protein